MREVFQQSPAQWRVGLFRHLARRKRFDKVELGLVMLVTQGVMATMDGIQLHRIPLKLMVVLESSKALISWLNLYSTSRPDTSHIVHNVLIEDRSGEMQCMGALIDCSTTRTIMAPRLPRLPGLADKPAYVMTLGLNGQAIAPKERVKTLHSRFSRQWRYPWFTNWRCKLWPCGLTTWFLDCLDSSPDILMLIGNIVGVWLCKHQGERKRWQWTW